MPYPHHSMSSPSGAYAVRPGTSAALTARTIDATVHPPIVRAQETVAQVVPRVAESFRTAFTSPLFISALALTLIFVWILSRMRRQLSGLAMGAMLVIALTSFTAPRKPQPKRVVDLKSTPKTTRNRMQSTSWNGYGYIAPRQVEQPVVLDYPDPNPDPVPTPDSRFDPVDIVLPATPVTPMPEWRDEVMRNVEREAQRLMQDPQFREIILRLRAQAREEARQRRWRRDF